MGDETTDIIFKRRIRKKQGKNMGGEYAKIPTGNSEKSKTCKKYRKHDEAKH